MSHLQIFYHIVFGTKFRKPSITEEYCKDLYGYIFGIVKSKGCRLYRINGTEDHLHLFTDLHPTVCLSDFIKTIKVASSKWMKASGHFPYFEHWQDGYAAFTYSIKEKETIIGYIRNQKEHHKKECFHDEYKRLLIAHDIAFEEKYLL